MKNRALIITIVVLIISSMTMMSFGLNSINPGTTQPTGENGTVSKEVDTSMYDSEDVKNLVDAVNAGEDITPAEFINELPNIKGKDNAEEFPTTDGYDVNLELYDRLTDFYEVKKSEGGVLKTVSAGDVEITVPTTIGMKGTDLLILVIDQSSGELYLVPLKSFNSATGKMKFKMPCQGPYCVVKKIPIVVRNVDPDKYPDKVLTKSIKSLPDNEVIDCDEFLSAVHQETSKLEVADGVKVKPENYSSAIALSDVAVSLGTDFSYDLSTKFKANLFRGNDKVDWERILRQGGVDYDKSAILKDDKELTKIEPITLKDSFLYHIDAATKEVSIIYEPTVTWSTYEDLTSVKGDKLTKENIQYFDVDDIDLQNIPETQLKVVEDASEVSLLGVQEVYAGTKEVATDTEDVCLVINGDQYIGMGPFLLFLPKKSEASFPWWIILLIVLLLAVVIYIIYRNNRNKKNKKNA